MLESVIRRDLAGELVLAHELTHALQDQHFGLDTGRADAGEDDAAARAARRLRRRRHPRRLRRRARQAEPGTRRRASPRKLEGVEGQITRDYPDIPALVRESIVFQYVAGVNFVVVGVQERGLGRRERAARAARRARPSRSCTPRSTSSGPRIPLRIQLGALAPYLRGEWQLAEEATLGELTIRILAERFVDHARATAIAAGWDGDRLVALVRTAIVALVWLTAWDTRAGRDASSSTAWTRDRRAPSSGSACRAGDTSSTLGGADPYYFERRGTKVLSIEGPLDADLTALADRIWRAASSSRTCRGCRSTWRGHWSAARVGSTIDSRGARARGRCDGPSAAVSASSHCEVRARPGGDRQHDRLPARRSCGARAETRDDARASARRVLITSSTSAARSTVALPAIDRRDARRY